MLVHLKKLNRLFDRKDKLKLAGLFLLMLIASLFDALSVTAVPVLVTILSDGASVLENSEYQFIWDMFNITDLAELTRLGAIFLVAAFLLKNTFLAVYKYIVTRFIYKRYAQLGDRLFASYVNAPYSWHLNRNSAQLLRNVTQETQLLVINFLYPMLKLMMHVTLIVLVTIVLLVYANILLTLLIVFVLGGGSMFFLRILRDRLKTYGKEEQEFRSLMIQSVNEGLGGLKDSRVMGRTGFFRNAFRHNIHRTARASGFREFIEQLTIPMIETIAVIGVLLMAFILLVKGEELQVIISQLTLLGVATARLMPAFKIVVQLYTKIRYYSYVTDPVYDDISEIEELMDVTQSDDTGEKIELKRTIELQNVSFQYPSSSENALENVSLTIRQGQAVAFIGPSGSGKTTIVDVLLGLLAPTEGRVVVDGIDIDRNTRAWQKNVGYIPQFIFLSDTSIRRNIAFGLPEEKIDDEQLIRAVKAAQLEDYIEQLPDGLDTVIGERGVRLSGGQRQRIGIARALYSNPQVLIMDEATSALDNNTERMVVSAIENLRGDRTIVTIAHRLTTVRGADMLYYLDDGKVKKAGTYEDLLENMPEFRLLADGEPAASEHKDPPEKLAGDTLNSIEPDPK